VKRFPTMSQKGTSKTPQYQKRTGVALRNGASGDARQASAVSASNNGGTRGKRARTVSIDRAPKDFLQTLTTKSTPSVRTDKDIVRKLITEEDNTAPNNTPLARNNEILRRHFLRMTELFLMPLEQYFASLMPLVKVGHQKSIRQTHYSHL